MAVIWAFKIIFAIKFWLIFLHMFNGFCFVLKICMLLNILMLFVRRDCLFVFALIK